jgi:hypothetical protein
MATTGRGEFSDQEQISIRAIIDRNSRSPRKSLHQPWLRQMLDGSRSQVLRISSPQNSSEGQPAHGAVCAFNALAHLYDCSSLRPIEIPVLLPLTSCPIRRTLATWSFATASLQRVVHSEEKERGEVERFKDCDSIDWIAGGISHVHPLFLWAPTLESVGRAVLRCEVLGNGPGSESDVSLAMCAMTEQLSRLANRSAVQFHKNSRANHL